MVTLSTILIFTSLVVCVFTIFGSKTTAERWVLVNNMNAHIIGIMAILSLRPQLESCVDILLVYSLLSYVALAVFNKFYQGVEN